MVCPKCEIKGVTPLTNHDASEQAYKNGYSAGYEAGRRSVGVQKWIPVTERLPDTQEYDWVLAQIAFIPGCLFGVPVVAELRDGKWYDAYDETIEGEYEKVTHWMLLPEPPNRGADMRGGEDGE